MVELKLINMSEDKVELLTMKCECLHCDLEVNNNWKWHGKSRGYVVDLHFIFALTIVNTGDSTILQPGLRLFDLEYSEL